MKSNPVLLKLEANLRASEALAEYQRRRIECLTRQLEWIAKRLSDLKQCPKLDNGDYLYEYTGDCDNNCPECWSVAAEVDTYEDSLWAVEDKAKVAWITAEQARWQAD